MVRMQSTSSKINESCYFLLILPSPPLSFQLRLNDLVLNKINRVADTSAHENLSGNFNGTPLAGPKEMIRHVFRRHHLKKKKKTPDSSYKSRTVSRVDTSGKETHVTYFICPNGWTRF